MYIYIYIYIANRILILSSLFFCQVEFKYDKAVVLLPEVYSGFIVVTTIPASSAPSMTMWNSGQLYSATASVSPFWNPALRNEAAKDRAATRDCTYV